MSIIESLSSLDKERYIQKFDRIVVDYCPNLRKDLTNDPTKWPECHSQIFSG